MVIYGFDWVSQNKSSIKKKCKRMNTEINRRVFDKFPVLTGEGLLFRELTKIDALDLFQIRSNAQVMKYMDSLCMKSLNEAKTLISNIHLQYRQHMGITWGIVDPSDNKLIGTFGFWRIIHQHCRAEIGYSLHPDYWGKGIMTKAFKILLEFGFDKLQLHSIEANVNPGNLASIRLLERIGFRKEAHFKENFLFNKQFTDSAIYCLLESDSKYFNR
jgi:[ribosomal protein S5]-alanine N-acetyltransferase